MMLFLEAFESIWSIGLIIFGGHLMIVREWGLGIWLLFRGEKVPKGVWHSLKFIFMDSLLNLI